MIDVPAVDAVHDRASVDGDCAAAPLQKTAAWYTPIPWMDEN
jgi:hypothetical protein